MPTFSETKGLRQWLQSQGYGIEITRGRQRVQWYKADGTPLPGLVPASPYHIHLCRSKGWTLRPPTPTAGDVPSEVSPHQPTAPKPHRRRQRGPLARFLAESCNLGPDRSTTNPDLWTAYETWARATGEIPAGRKTFTQSMASIAGVTRGRTGKARRWKGIGLRA